MSLKLLIINPGSTSTKIGIYEDEKEVLVETLRHPVKELKNYKNIYNQYEFRRDIIQNFFKEKNIDINSLDAVVGRGGLLKPIKSGTYRVNNIMINDLKAGVLGEHASNLGGILANEIASITGIPAFIVDPVVVDEMQDVARLSGVLELPRTSIFHALNQKAVAKRYAKENNMRYEDLNAIVVHMGGGVSVGAHKNGKVIDVNNALDGEGPFSPERAGSVPVGDLIKMCYSGKFTKDEAYKKILGEGGFMSYLKTNNAIEVERLVNEGDKEATLCFDAFIYQVAKYIGEMATVLDGCVDIIILTGGVAYWKDVEIKLKKKVGFISKIKVYPGEDELLALAQGAIRVIKGEEKEKEYK